MEPVARDRPRRPERQRPREERVVRLAREERAIHEQADAGAHAVSRAASSSGAASNPSWWYARRSTRR